MRYDGIEITGTDRFMVSQITGLKLIPESRVQMILGKNGAGKSSLMTMGFTPFAPHPRFFPNGGSWKVHVFHKCAYTISATYGDKVHYSFIDSNGEELNKSRNVTSQNELIKRYLDLTPDIQELITGNVPLTKLSPQGRRDWMSKLSDSDFSFAFRALNHYKKVLSHNESVVKYISKQINDETAKLVPEEELIKLRDQRESSQKVYDEIQETPHYPVEKRVTLTDLQASIEAISSASDNYLLIEPHTPSHSSIDALLTATESNKDVCNHLEGSMDVMSNDIVELQQELGRIETHLGDDYATLTAKHDGLVKELEELPNLFGIPSHYLQSSGQVIAAIRYALMQVPSTTPDADERARIRQVFDAANDKLGRAQQMIDQINSNLDLINKVEVVSCPSCNHSFKPGIDPDMLDKLNKRREAGFDYMKSQTDEVEDAREQLVNVRLTEQCIAELEEVKHTYVRSHPGIFNYLDSIEAWGVGKLQDTVLQQYESECLLHHKREHLLNQLSVLKQAITAQTAYTAELPGLKKRLDEKLSAYGLVKEQYRHTQSTNLTLLEEVRHGQRLEEEHSRIMVLVDSLYADIESFVRESQNQLRAADLRRMTSSIAMLDELLTGNDAIADRIKDFEVSLTSHKLDAAAAKAIVDELSPKTGLIAEQIHQQIGTVLNAMNAVIAKIWGYDIRIGVGDVSEGGLDYKLPLYVGRVPRGDISEGSSSMKEIIDRAWVITAMICLGMEDYPLYQDEPAITFDDEHGLNFVPMIKELIETDQFSQLVIISHDVDTQTAFPSADVLVLGDKVNPHIHTFNQHVEFYHETA